MQAWHCFDKGLFVILAMDISHSHQNSTFKIVIVRLKIKCMNCNAGLQTKKIEGASTEVVTNHLTISSDDKDTNCTAMTNLP